MMKRIFHLTNLFILVGMFAAVSVEPKGMLPLFVYPPVLLILSAIGYKFNEKNEQVFALALFLLAWFDMKTHSGMLLFALSHFVFGIQIIKARHEKQRENRGWIYLLTLVNFLVAGFVSQDITFIFEFVLFLVIGSILMVRDQLSRGKEESGITAVNMATVVSVILLPLTTTAIIGFLVAPRGFARAALDKAGPAISGFSDQFCLGDVSIFKDKSDRVVMRVKADRPYRMRGKAFRTFTGVRWRTGRQRTYLPATAYMIHVDSLYPERKTDGLVEQKITILGLKTQVLFGAMMPVKFFSNMRGIFLDDVTLTYYKPGRIGESLPYVAFSRLPERRADVLRTASLNTTWAGYRIYTQVPRTSRRFRELARTLTKNEHTIYDKAARVESYLKENFLYSLEADVDEMNYPLEDFLFILKEGHCEYFATAMAIILRSVGIPARVVSGFLPGEENRLGGYYMIRQSDAHAWVEVFFFDYGWVPFDPTPPSDHPFEYIYKAKRFLGRHIDFLDDMWRRFVIDFSLEAQRSLTEALWNLPGKAAAKFMNLLFSDESLINAHAPIFIVCMLSPAIFLGACLLYRYMRRHIIWARKLAPDWSGPGIDESRIFYRNGYLTALAELRRIGLEKKPVESPDEFRRRVIQNVPECADAFSDLTTIYLERRFGNTPAFDSVRERYKLLSREIRRNAGEKR